jgi:hypothetical protein
MVLRLFGDSHHRFKNLARWQVAFILKEENSQVDSNGGFFET